MATQARKNPARETRRDAGQLETPLHNHVFRNFSGLNTQAKRQALTEGEFSWLENVMPIGHGNLATLPASSPALAAVANGTCYYMKSYNIAGLNYMFMATDTGHAYQVALESPYAVTEITDADIPTLATQGLQIAQWENERILIGDPETGLWDWDGATLTHDTADDAPDAISCIETFSGRVWASFGRTLLYSAPGSYTDWQAASAGGSVIITDQTLHSDIKQLISANNFLYFIGVDSVNVIGDVSINSLGDTIFSNTNLTASVGTEFAYTLIPYFRSVWLANKSGVYAISGATPVKTSDDLDEILRRADFSRPLSGGAVMLENILCAAFLLQYTERVDVRPLLVIFFNKKWFLASQGSDLILIAGGENNGLQNLYGTNGTSLFHLFGDPDTAVNWTIQPGYWDMKDVTITKQAVALGFEVDVDVLEGNVQFNIDRLYDQPPYVDTQSYNVPVTSLLEWINDSEVIVPWINDDLFIVQWIGDITYVMVMQDGSNFGKYLGVTMTSSDVIGTFSSIMLRYAFREKW